MLHHLKELSDFGLLILIWLVQLIIYPSFTYMEESNLSAWHPKYTNMITIVVMPLMLIQLFTSFFLAYSEFNWLLLIQCVLIVLIWAATFFQAVPLHNQIENGDEMRKAANLLVSTNWKRTIMWTVIVILNFASKLGNIKQLM